MTIDQLIGRLEEYRERLGAAAEVRLMWQRSQPFEHSITCLFWARRSTVLVTVTTRMSRTTTWSSSSRENSCVRVETGVGGCELKPKRPTRASSQAGALLPDVAATPSILSAERIT